MFIKLSYPNSYLVVTNEPLRNFIFMISVLFLIISIILFLPSVKGDDDFTIKLISPSGDEKYNEIIDIKWDVDNVDSNDEILIYIFYCYENSNEWIRINNEGLKNNGSFKWDSSNLSDGHYNLKIEAVSQTMNIAYDNSDVFVIDNNRSDIKIKYISLINIEENKEIYWIKNGDNLVLKAKITNATDLNCDDIKADLSGFFLYNNTIAESFDGEVALWNINNVYCIPQNGQINVKITVYDIESSTLEVNADNIRPNISIIQPKNGFYLFNKRFLPITKTIIIGPISFRFDIEENFGISIIECYVNGILTDKINDDFDEWYLNTKMKGYNIIKFIAYDNCLNNDMDSIEIYAINF